MAAPASSQRHADVARRLGERREAIIEAFVVGSRAELEAARALDRDGLVDSLPDLLDNLIATLAEGESRAHADASTRIGAEHGRVRAAQLTYALDDLLVEYRILARTITAALRDGHALSPEVENTINDAIYRGIASSANALVQVRNAAEHARAAQHEKLLDDLQASRALLETVLQHLPVAVSLTDARTGKGLFQNPLADQLTERGATSRERFDDYAHFGAIHADDTPYAASDYPTPRVARTGVPIHEEPMRYRRRDGSVLVLAVSSRPLRDADGTIGVVLTTFRDVTDHVEARQRLVASEAAQRQARAQLRQIADSVPVHLLQLDRDERFLFVNSAAAALWNLSPDDFLGKSIVDVLGADAQRALAPHSARALAGEIVSYEAAFRSPDGTVRTFLNTYTPVAGPDGSIAGFIATGTDITERKQAEETLRETVARLHEERELRERFVAALSHDLRTPLSAARMGADLLVRVTDDPARIQRLAGRIGDNIDRADRMIRDLLDASSIRAGEKLPLEPTPCDLTAVTRQTLDDLASLHGERFVLRAPAKLEGEWDCGAVRRLLDNLCTNALKYGAAHRPITVTLEGHPAHATLRVHNEGDPIPAAELAHLFEPFRRAPGARATGQEGWGLGLSLVKGIAEAHGGHAEVTSNRGTGTEFSVVLPRARPG